MFLALIIAVTGSYFFALRRGFKSSDALWMLIGMGLSVFTGARLLNVIVSFKWYYEDPSRIFAFSSTGFSLYGGGLIAIGVGAIISKFRTIPLRKFADTVIPFTGLGVVFMRIGCFLNGCCFGEETDLPWGVIFPTLSPAHTHQLTENVLSGMTVAPVHPTQLYELLAALAGALLAFILIRKKAPDGTAFLVFAIWFSAFRWLNLNWRVMPAVTTVPDYFYPILYAAIIAVCSIILVILLHDSNKDQR